jgi:MYXO-CTERM domain-containing protein
MLGMPRHDARVSESGAVHGGLVVAAVQPVTAPLPFESNVGQWDARAKFGARLGRSRVFITDTGPRFLLARSTVGIHFGPSRSTLGELPLRGTANYFIGADPSRWRTGVSTFGRVRAVGVAPGVDVVYRGAGPERMEYDLVLAPRASIASLSFFVSGGLLALRTDGALEVRTPDGAIVQHPPRAFQRRGENAVIVDVSFRLLDEAHVGFDVGAYDPDRELVVDPLVSSTYLGGVGSEQPKIVVDVGGSAYVSGYTTSADFPIQGGVDGVMAGPSDAFVTKLDPSGATFVYSTYIGGSADEYGAAIAVDGAGAAYVAGVTYSADFPMVNPYQASYGSGADAFVLKLAPNGAALDYSTYLRGTTNQVPSDGANAIAVDSSGSCYVAGTTLNSDFPTTIGSFEPALLGQGRAAFVTKFAPSGNALVYSTFIGSAANTYASSLAIDASGDVVVAGDVISQGFPVVNALQPSMGGGGDGWVAKVNPSGSALLFATYLGGSGSDLPLGLAVDSVGRVYVVGSTNSSDFPTAAPLQSHSSLTQGFVSALSANGSSFVYSTYLDASPTAIAVDASGRATVVGATNSSTFPQDLGAFQSYSGGADAFVLQLKPAGDGLMYASFLGTAGQDSATSVSLAGDTAWLVGTTDSAAFPILGAAQSTLGGGQDAFVVHVTPPACGVAPSTATVPIFATKKFTAFGGSGVYTYAMQSNPSGGSIDPSTGTYTAGSVLNVSDVVKATDSLGAGALATINVVSDIGIVPPTATVAPLGSKNFVGAGGTGGYTFTMANNPSGGMVTSGGLYTAGATGNVTDVVRVTDGAANTTTAAISVGAALAISPSGPTVPPHGNVIFTASGGAPGYAFSFVTNASGGSVGGGYYQAGASPAVDDAVKVTDSNGAVATTIVHVGPGVIVSPSNPKSPPKGTISFTASGGSGTGYTWFLANPGSGTPKIDSTTGVYTAGPIANTVDQVLVRDDLFNSTPVNVSVGGGIAINPAQPYVSPRGSVQLVATGGSEMGQVWSITTNASGALIDPKTGKYTAGSAGPARDVVSVIDSLSLTGSVEVAVGASASITPTAVSAKPGTVVFFVGSGGSGLGATWTVSVNGSGATIDSSGRYVAGPKEDSTDIILLSDSLGNTAIAVVSVLGAADSGAQPLPSPPSQGCTCRVAPTPSADGPWLVVAALLLFSRIRRRS